MSGRAKKIGANASISKLQEIEVAILQLSEKDGLHLAKKILGSLARPSDAMESDEILAEAVGLDAELESGVVKPLTEQVFRDGVRGRSS